MAKRPAPATPWHAVPDPANYFSTQAPLLSALPQSLLVFTRLVADAGTLTALHHRFVLQCCIEGEGLAIIDGRVFRFGQGECVLVHPYQGHYFTNPGGGALCWFFTTFEYAAGNELEALRNGIHAFGADDLTTVERWRDAFLARDYTGCAGLLAGFLGRRLAGRSRRAEPVSAGRGRPSTLPDSDEVALVARVGALVNRQLHVACDGETLSARLGVSHSRLRVLFRRRVGIPLGEYVRRARIYRACQLLGGGHGNITEVAEACGFSSLYAFSRTFKNLIGQSPKRFWNRGQPAVIRPARPSPLQRNRP